MSPEGVACNQIYELLQVMSLESVLAEAEDQKFDDDEKICLCGTNYAAPPLCSRLALRGSALLSNCNVFKIGKFKMYS